MAKHKSVDERLADAKRVSDQAAAKVRALEVQQRAAAARLRQRGEKLAVKLVSEGVTTNAGLAEALWELADRVPLKPEERAALALVLGEQPSKKDRAA